MATADEDDVPEWMRNNALYKEIMQAYEPTPEDIAKKLRTDELKLLCQRVRCRVDMWKYNPVQDFASVFHEQGRFYGQSEKFINKLLLKAYRKRGHYFKAIEEEKEKVAEREWQQRKKMSLLRLNQWRYEEEQRLRDSEIETVVAPAYEPIEIEHSEDNISVVNLQGELQICINSESMTLDTQSMVISEMSVEVLNPSTIDRSLRASQMLDEPVMPCESEAQSQEVDYNNFQEHRPLTSTQDRVC